MVIKVDGRLSKKNKKLRRTARFTIEGEIAREEWEEFFEKLKALLNKHGLKVKKA